MVGVYEDRKQYQDRVRRWWISHAENPMLLQYLWMSPDGGALQHWMDMQVRVAMAAKGEVVSFFWGRISSQLKYSPLWVARWISSENLNDLGYEMMSRYHVIRRDAAGDGWELVEASEIVADISVDRRELYSWIGAVGGSVNSS